jgi:hypothetical protein
MHAENASMAHFTPDSQQVVFITSEPSSVGSPSGTLRVRSGPRVERWRISDETRMDSPEIRGIGCVTEELSPDGSILACDDAAGTLRVVDAASTEVLLERHKFVKLIRSYNYLPDGSVDLPNGRFLGDLGQTRIDFSPDCRFLVARPIGGEGRPIAYDVLERRIVDLKGRLREIASGGCFLAPHRLLVVPAFHNKRGATPAEVLAFPSSQLLSRLKIPSGRVFRSSDPDFVLIRPFGLGALLNPSARRAAAAELRTGQVIISDTPALDVLGEYYIAEPFPDVVGLYRRGKGLQATVPLHQKDRLWQRDATGALHP